MFKKMKSVTGIVLAGGIAAVTALGAASPVMAEPTEDLSGKTVIIYTGNLRGNVDLYPKVATAKKDYESKGATVYLVDAGNYLQGGAMANSERGLFIYNLMDAAGYDVAGMGTYDFVHADATTGMIYHGNFYKYYTQAELLEGTDELEYATNRDGSQTATRAAKAPASFTVVSSNIDITEKSFYSFNKTIVKTDSGISVGFMGITDPETPDALQDDFMAGYEFTDMVTTPISEVTVCLDSYTGTFEGADIVIPASSDDSEVAGVYVIDDETGDITSPNVDLTAFPDDPAVTLLANQYKEALSPVAGTTDVTFVGADRTGWCEETNLGDFVADALVWYANNKMEAFEKDAPLVGIINGGNCDQYIYTGEITKVDLLRSLPFSPMGVGIVYLTGQELWETIEASQNMYSKKYEGRCPGFAQVANMEYTIDTDADYDEGEEYGNFYLPASIQVTAIRTVDGINFDPEATYAVIADNYIMNGGDTYATIARARENGAKYINNGNAVRTRDIVEMYIKEALNGQIPEDYAEAQGRIIECTHSSALIINSVAATCVSEGYTGDLYCTECETQLSWGEIIPKLSETGTHTWTVNEHTDAEGWVVVKSATETEEGLAERVCSVDAVKETKVIPKLDPVLRGWVNIGAGWLYYDENGEPYRGWHYMGEKEGEATPHWSYFREDAVLVTGWKYFTQADGESTPHWSYFGNNGWLRTGWQYLGEADGEATPHWSYFGSNGWLRTGWQYLTAADGETTPHWSYFGNNGWMRTGWQYLGEADGEATPHWSYFGSNGWMRTGWQYLGEADGEKTPHWSYFGSNGWLRLSWQDMGKGTANPDGNSPKHRSYFGDNGWLRTGSQTIDGKNYKFDTKGWLIL